MSRITGHTRRPATRLGFLSTRVDTRVLWSKTRIFRVIRVDQWDLKKINLVIFFKKKIPKKKIKKKFVLKCVLGPKNP